MKRPRKDDDFFADEDTGCCLWIIIAIVLGFVAICLGIKALL